MAWTPKVITVDWTGLTTASTPYLTGEQLGPEKTILSAALSNAGFGLLMGITLVDDANILGAVDAFIFSDSTTPASDNAAAAWSDADSAKLISDGPLLIPAPVSVTNNRVGGATFAPFLFQCGAGHDDLFVNLVTRSGHTFFVAADDIHLRVKILQYS